ncbi:MAG: ribbon-helix-helix protein, CopG family [Candidatus Thermoplasmatota archaeon]|nr:ribbon-helix-helix protein, CopG family [Candidatus Thermoplasmatota archaeon]
MKKTEKLTIRFPREILDRLTEVAQRRDITISELVRENLSEYLQSEYSELYQERITVRLPADHLDKLKVLVQSRDAFSVENAIQLAVKDYIARRPKEMIQEREILRKISEQRGLIESAQESAKRKLKR